MMSLVRAVALTLVLAGSASAFSASGCLDEAGETCFGPSIASGTIFDFDGRLEVDALLGVGYGVRFFSKKPWSLGVDVLADYSREEDGESSARFSLVSGAFKVLRIGVGVELREGKRARGFGILGIGLDFKSP